MFREFQTFFVVIISNINPHLKEVPLRLVYTFHPYIYTIKIRNKWITKRRKYYIFIDEMLSYY